MKHRIKKKIFSLFKLKKKKKISLLKLKEKKLTIKLQASLNTQIIPPP